MTGFDAIVDTRATKPIIFHADYVDDENRCEETMVEHGCMVYPTLQEAVAAQRVNIFVRDASDAATKLAIKNTRRRKKPPRIVTNAP